MKRKLFCEISPLTYRISTKKEILMRKIRDLPLRGKFARVKQEELLPVRIKKHASLIRRWLGNVDMQLQETEVAEVRWVNREGLIRLVEEERFVPYYFIRRIFDLYRGTGAIEADTGWKHV